MVAALTNAHINTQRLDSNCPFLSVVETAGLCHVNERGGSEIEINNPLFLQPQIRFGVWLGVYGCQFGVSKDGRLKTDSEPILSQLPARKSRKTEGKGVDRT